MTIFNSTTGSSNPKSGERRGIVVFPGEVVTDSVETRKSARDRSGLGAWAEAAGEPGPWIHTGSERWKRDAGKRRFRSGWLGQERKNAIDPIPSRAVSTGRWGAGGRRDIGKGHRTLQQTDTSCVVRMRVQLPASGEQISVDVVLESIVGGIVECF
jgi:hypothetical protein